MNHKSLSETINSTLKVRKNIILSSLGTQNINAISKKLFFSSLARFFSSPLVTMANGENFSLAKVKIRLKIRFGCSIPSAWRSQSGLGTAFATLRSLNPCAPVPVMLSLGGFLLWRGDSSKGESSNFESKRQTDTKSRKNPE